MDRRGGNQGEGQHMVRPITGLTQVLALNEEDVTYNADGEEEEKLWARPPGAGAAVSPAPPLPVQLEPVGVFWDIENCWVPDDKSAFALANKIRKMFFEGKREAEFVCVCDITKERRVVTDALNKAQVTLVHVSAVAKNAADDKLRQSLRRFAHTYHPPCTLVLISGDVNFAPELKDLRHAHNITITLVHNRQASDALKVFANNLFLFDDLLQDLEPARIQPSPVKCAVIVSGLPRRADEKHVANILGVMSDNCGGKVLNVDLVAGKARILYRSHESALKSSQRMTGEKVYGSVITAVVEQGPQSSRDHRGPQPLLQSPPRHPLPSPSRTLSGPQPRQLTQQPPPSLSNAGFPPLPSSSANSRPVVNATTPPSCLLPPILPGPFFPPPHPPVRGPRLPLMVPPQSGTGAGGAWSIGAPPLPQQAAPPPSDPQIRLLVNTRSGFPARVDEVKKRVLAVCVQSSVKAQVVQVLWYSYSELHVLLWLDILQSATEQKDAVADICRRGALSVDIAKSFGDVCCKAIEKGCQQWKAEVCNWGEDEQSERLARSHAVELLIELLPGKWMKWTTFRQKYQHRWKTCISEMFVMTSCEGAISILKGAMQAEQVVMVAELSPLVRVRHDQKTEQVLKDNVVSLLTRQRDKKIRFLDFVEEYVKLFGPLPLLPGRDGKPLSLIIEGIPGVAIGGDTLPNTFIVLQTVQPSPQPSSQPFSQSSPQPFPQPFSQSSPRPSSQPSPQPSSQPSSQPSVGFAEPGCKLLAGGTLKPLGILINTMREHPANVEELRGLLTDICVQSAVTTERMSLLRYSYSELHVYMRLDIHGSAVAQKDAVAELHQKGCLTAEMATCFVVVCCQALQKVCKQRNLPWVAEVCCWEEGEEKDRELRSQIIELLAQSPLKWMMWNEFREQYSKRFKTKIESVNSYKNAVTLFDSPSPDNQVILLNELSPLIMVRQNGKLVKNLVTLLNSLPGRKIPLLSIVQAYKERFGNIPVVPQKQGKPLFDVLKTIPEVNVTGEKLFNQVVELAEERRPQPCLKNKDNSSSGNEASRTPAPTLPADLQMCECLVEALLYSLPGYKVSLDCFEKEYERMHGAAVGDTYCGLSTLEHLLEAMPNTVELITEESICYARLKLVRVFACDMQKLLAAYPDGIEMRSLASCYKATFGHELVVKNYGFSKLSKALEAFPNVFQIQGIAQNKIITLRRQPACPDSLMDEAMAILLTSTTQSLPLVQFTGQYNKAFSSKTGKLSSAYLADALRTLPNIEVIANSRGTIVVHLRTTPTAVQDIRPSQPRDEEWSTISSEVRWILLCHKEHAMTINELVENLRKWEYPALPSPITLYQYLKKATTENRTFEINHILSSLPDSYVQLNLGDCLKKLCQDLLHVFVCHATTAGHSRQWDTILSSYATLFHHELNLSIYGFEDVHNLMKRDAIKALIQFDQASGLCSLTCAGAKQVLSSLLAELLFTKGAAALGNVPHLYQAYFETPLHLCGASSFVGLIKESPFSIMFEVHDNILDLSPDARFAEQLRHLLTIHCGKVPLSQLHDLLLKELGISVGANVTVLKTYCGDVASHVVSCTRSGYVVWAPSSYPYPSRRGNSRESSDISIPVATTVSAPSDPAMDVITRRENTDACVEAPAPIIDVQNLVVNSTCLAEGLAPVEGQFDCSELNRMIEDLRLNKDSSGSLDVDKLDPFLDYFVEITSKALNNLRLVKEPSIGEFDANKLDPSLREFTSKELTSSSDKLQKPLPKPRSNSKRLACQFQVSVSDPSGVGGTERR